jgi:CheY-like chemotaxis protein
MGTILIVDDNQAVREVLRSILERGPYRVITATGGAVAMELLESEKIDLALIDIEMPDMSGYDLCAYLKTHAKWRTIPVMLMTGRAIVGVPEQAEAVGAEQLIAKPFERAELLRSIRALLGSSKTNSPHQE